MKENQKITVFSIGSFGGLQTDYMTLKSHEFTKYAQYENALKLTYKPRNKRKLYEQYYYKQLIIVNEWVELPEELLHNVEYSNGFKTTSTKYLSCDKEMLKVTLDYLRSIDADIIAENI